MTNCNIKNTIKIFMYLLVDVMSISIRDSRKSGMNSELNSRSEVFCSRGLSSDFKPVYPLCDFGGPSVSKCKEDSTRCRGK